MKTLELPNVEEQRESARLRLYSTGTDRDADQPPGFKSRLYNLKAAYWSPWLAQSVEHGTLDLPITKSSPILGIEIT